MNHTVRQRVLIARTTTIAMAAGGLAAGYLLGWALSLQSATNWLDRYAKLTAAQDDASFTEARSVLSDLNAAPYPFCSDAEIAYYRGLVFSSQYLKDAGRIRNGKIDCSAASGHPARFIRLGKPDSRKVDGAIAYSDFPSVLSTGPSRENALQLGTAYVAFDSKLPASSGPFPMQISVAIKNAGYRQARPPASEALLGQMLNWSFGDTARPDDSLHATECSANQFICVTASTPVSEAMHGEMGTVTGTALAGGLFGALLGIAFSFAFGRKRDLHRMFTSPI